MLANNMLIGGCADNRRRERDIVVHAQGTTNYLRPLALLCCAEEGQQQMY